MRIGCLQFAPEVGDIDNNLNRADSVLNRADRDELESLDLLVLPEMAFTGYNFESLEEIQPYLEPKGSGISALWARTTALKYNCKVAVGYPETSTDWSGPVHFNSLLLVNEDGETLANYRKQHLYYKDETWCKEGTGGFFQGEVDGIGQTALGICMDINPYKFERPWHQFEFAFHILESQANVVIISMAWSTLEDRAAFCSKPYEPDMETLEYWAKRMEPLIRAERDAEIILIFANRCGIEREALYAGTSAVMGIQNGEVKVYGVLGRGTKHLLVVDTDNVPFARLVSRPGRDTAEGEWDGVTTNAGVKAHDLPLPDYDELDRLVELSRATDPICSRPSAPVHLLPVDCPLSACVPEKSKEAVREGSFTVHSQPLPFPLAQEATLATVLVDPSKPTELHVNPTKEKTANCAISFGIAEMAPSGLIEMTRADSPTLTPARPRLRILTGTSPAPANNLHYSDNSARPMIALPRDLITPPPSGQFPGQEYLAAGHAEVHVLSATTLYSPEEPVLPSACQLISPAPALENVPTVEHSQEADSVPQMEVQTPLTAILAPEAVPHGYIPLILSTNVSSEGKHCRT
ncbi:uncharacterized protein PpBr36_10362 [Pyricularia pennisetigena]|uniref:uncharacterized protein n=1 Tax=Pyricularia pennisetigena TaxID=1578925 RepID=UPI001151B1FB|nr:uncharacterized protein PpBr36_10362 [Pyricularia pennisetigena]TLS21343.1 hypothetical protein PpBr36_10362 [Pyricularia pennisetigena]